MQILTTDQEMLELFDDKSVEFLIETLQKDSFVFYNKIDGKENEWIGRVMLMEGPNHLGSTTSHGFLLRYQFQRILYAFDIAIKEIKVPESMDEFLDLFNEVNHDSMFFNMEYYGE
jgi:hypothetical protein